MKVKSLLRVTAVVAVTFFAFLLGCSNTTESPTPHSIKVVEIDSHQPFEIPYNEIHIFDQYGELQQPIPNLEYELQIFSCDGELIHYRNWSTGHPYTRIPQYDSALFKLIWGFYYQVPGKNLYKFHQAGQIEYSYKCNRNGD